MLRELHLRDTGPSPQLDATFAERLNVFTGDNGLGKSFLLDVVWWTLTETWAGHPAAPYQTPSSEITGSPAIHTSIDGSTIDWAYDFTRQTWHARRFEELDPPPTKPLVIYARVDGGIAVWDPLRTARGSAFKFSRDEVWNGLLGPNDRQLCNGLVRDWVLWQLQSAKPGRDRPFALLARMLLALSASPREQLQPGEPARLFLDDTTDYPTLVFPHGVVPVIHASAGIQRILTLAYMLTWTWYEHLQAAALARVQPASSIVFLIDEVESHLHPQWQRRILPALLRVLGELQEHMHVQLMATTHAPLVLASLEPHFDPERDRLFHFDLAGDRVTLHEDPWAREGEADAWLKSETFGLQQARSVEAERAVEAAKAWMRGDLERLPPGLDDEAAIDAALRRLLPPGDEEFMPLWIVHTRTLERR